MAKIAIANRIWGNHSSTPLVRLPGVIVSPKGEPITLCPFGDAFPVAVLVMSFIISRTPFFQAAGEHMNRLNIPLAIAFAALTSTALAQDAVRRFNSAELTKRTLERRAMDGAIWGMPLVSFDAMRQGFFRDAKAHYGDILYWSKFSTWKNQTTTPDTSTRYVIFFTNTKDGPVVVEVPPMGDAALSGTF